MTGVDVIIEHNGSSLTVTIHQDETHAGFDGSVFDAPVEIERFRLPANLDLIEAVGDELLAFYAKETPGGPPDDAPRTEVCDQ